MLGSNGPHMRLLIADDHGVTRQLIKEVVSQDHQVVGMFETCEDLLHDIEQLHPEIVLLDISIPAMGGFSAAEIIRRQYPETKIVFVSQYTDRAYVDRAMSLGASGYVAKRTLPSDILPAIHDAAEGKFFVSPQLSAH